MHRACLASVVVLSGLAGMSAGQSGPLDAPPPLPRYREGGTPYDPNQSLHPYAVSATTPLGRNANIWTPSEYSATRGVVYRYFSSQWPQVVTDCVVALTSDPTTDEIAYVCVNSSAQQTSATTAFTTGGANMSRVVFYTVPGESVWMRDYGPHFIFSGSGVGTGALSVVDSHYYPTRPQDNFVPTLVGEDHLRLHTRHVGLYYSGGNFQGGPNRSGFVTALVNLDNPAGEGFTPALIADLYQKYQGVDTLHVLPQLPFSVDGTGHIDMWLYLIDDEHVIISEFIPGSNATAISVTNNAVPYMEGLGYTVYRPKAWNVSSTHYTYANAYRVNNRIFVPVYGTSIKPGGNSTYNARDEEAMSIWNIAVGNSGIAPYPQVDFSRPKVTIVPIQCNGIIPAAGAIHCIIKQVPRHTSSMPAVFVQTPSAGDLWIGGTTRRISWSASDLDNATIPSFTLEYTTNGGVSWNHITTTTNAYSYNWTLPADVPYSTNSFIRVTANSVLNGTGDAANLIPITIAPGTQKVVDFTVSPNVDNLAWGFQTVSWANVGGVRKPAVSAVTLANLNRMAFSDATGGNTDPNRYISPNVSGGQECTHTYEFKVLDYSDEIDEIDQVVVRWEGYADRCTQSELYVWDYVASNWSDAKGNFGQNFYMDAWAGSRDNVLTGRIDGNFSRYIDANGIMTLLVYAERPADESFCDYVSVTLSKANCPTDFDGSGFVDFVDFTEFVLAFEDGLDSADYDNSGFVDFVDFTMFVQDYEVGC
ncbi:MAG: agmatine deiminase family protein [Phycisphaeraceae bacterium]|nr:agmatine deiminase family protein [Phycisphaerae bacterium]MBX3392953.1 agmatine deiminase family protein [Phycisphaeraceae bacterium]HRJ49186.1 agmatine deiminase family protein [Phycisphaerales bacterium]